MAGFVTYAQNFEDLMLWRALRNVDRGFYIDVGAADPTELSTTFAFYQRGWTGINIEPAPGYFSALEAARPHDLNLCCLLGSSAGSASFSHFAETGLSTTDPEVARQHTDLRGFQFETIERPVRTLSEICAEHARGEIHFLKIDVEGAERDVLLGADFSRWRPWIVLIEATEPLSNVENWKGWEPLLLEADYRFVWFDGLNRFYIAAEHAEQLEAAFQTPPNVFDEWSLPGAPGGASDISDLQAQIKALQTAEEARQIADRLRGENEERRESAHAAREAAARAQAAAEEGRQVADRLRGENEERRESAHAAREAASRTQAVVEEARQLADRLRGENEERRESAHASREAAAQAQALAEEARQFAERLRTEHEERRENAHALREAAAQSHAASETGRVFAENSRRAAEWERREAEEQRQASEQQRQKAEPVYVPVTHAVYEPEPVMRETCETENLQNLQAAFHKLQIDHAALLNSSSWRITAPIRRVVQVIRAPITLLRSHTVFRSRLRRIGGTEGSFTKRAMRIGMYGAARVCAHLPGGRSAARNLERVTPRLYRWLAVRYGAYRSSYLGAQETPAPAPVPPSEAVTPHIASPELPSVVPEPSTEEEIMLSRLRARNHSAS